LKIGFAIAIGRISSIDPRVDGHDTVIDEVVSTLRHYCSARVTTMDVNTAAIGSIARRGLQIGLQSLHDTSVSHIGANGFREDDDVSKGTGAQRKLIDIGSVDRHCCMNKDSRREDPDEKLKQHGNAIHGCEICLRSFPFTALGSSVFVLLTIPEIFCFETTGCEIRWL
jgi:hypothetical protein